MSNFDFIAGSLAIDASSSPYAVETSNIINRVFNLSDGYYAYKFASISQNKQQDVPTYLIVSRETGILVIDIVEKEIESCITHEDDEFWKSKSEYFESRELITLSYEDDIKSRLRGKPTLFNRKSKEYSLPIKSVIVFCENEKFDDFIDQDINIVGLNFKNLENFLKEYYQSLNNNILEEELFNQVCSQIDGTFIFEKNKISKT